jgi:sensor histidine kinase regulating citrate/malate metabolism
MYQSMNESYHEQRKKAHDYKNQMECVSELLGQNEIEKASAYVNNVCNAFIDEMNYVNTNHAIINAVINQKYKLAKAQGIAMVLSLNDLGGITVKDVDLVTILANLLDNAIEASEKLIAENRIIKFLFHLENGKITISVRNPLPGELKTMNGYPMSTKQNPSAHGIGIMNIESAVSKYNGESNFSYHDGFFTHTIIIKS